MSKKLIAVASAAALALTAFVATPAVAAPTIAIGAGVNSAAGTEAAPVTVNVPWKNTIQVATDVSAVLVDINTLLAGDVVSVTTTGTVKLLEQEVASPSKNLDNTTLGKSSFSKTMTANDNLDLWAYTTSTTTGTVAVSITRTGLSTSKTFYIKGIAGAPVNLKVGAVPATLAKGATSVVTFTASDVFGNAVEDSTANSNSISADAVRSSHMGLISWDAAAKVYKSTMTSATNGPFIASIGMPETGLYVDRDGLKAASRDLIAVVNNAGVSTQVATLTAQVAALQAQVEKRVSKKRFNTLARKWNRAFPSQAVKLKK